MSAWTIWKTLLTREVALLVRHRSSFIMAAIFFVQVAALFPLGMNPQPDELRLVGQTVIPVCALLSSILLLPLFFADDFQDGSLIDLLLLPVSSWVFVWAKVCVHAVFSALMLIVITPFMAVLYQFDMVMVGRTALSMLLLAPTLSALGCLSSALTLGLRHAHVLPALIYLPLSVPTLIFAMLALSRNHTADWYLLAAMMIASVFLLPLAAAVAIRWAVS